MAKFYIVSYEVRELGNRQNIYDTGSFVFTIRGKIETADEAEEVRQMIDNKLNSMYHSRLVPVILSISKL